MSDLPVYAHLTTLSEPLRARLLRVLVRAELTVSELVRVVQLPQSTVSRHLKVLRTDGWVQARRDGTATRLQLDPEALSDQARVLWAVIRDEDAEQTAEDERRLGAVLAERGGDGEAFLGQVADRWDEVRRDLFGSHFMLPALLALVPEALVVADLGCGPGTTSAHVAPAVRKVIAVDRLPLMLERAGHRLAAFDNVELRPGDLSALPIANEEVDVALCVLVLHHVRDVPAALAEIRRILRERGRCIIVDMIAHDREEFRHSMGHQHLGFEDDLLDTQANEAGLELLFRRRLPAEPNASGPGLFLACYRRA